MCCRETAELDMRKGELAAVVSAEICRRSQRNVRKLAMARQPGSWTRTGVEERQNGVGNKEGWGDGELIVTESRKQRLDLGLVQAKAILLNERQKAPGNTRCVASRGSHQKDRRWRPEFNVKVGGWLELCLLAAARQSADRGKIPDDADATAGESRPAKL